MDEKPEQIMSHIESQRNQLGQNLNELESRVKGATDWRVQFDKNPMLMMGVAVGGGLLLGSIVGGGRKSTSRSSNWSSSSRNYPMPTSSSYGSRSSSSPSTSQSSGSNWSASATSPAVSEQRRKATDTLEHIKAALIGFATAKVKEFMTEALPGFDQHLDDAQRRHASQQGSSLQQGSYSQGSANQAGNQGSSYERSQTGAQGIGNTGSYGSQSSGTQSTGSQATTRTEQSANSPYAQQGAGQNTGLNI